MLDALTRFVFGILNAIGNIVTSVFITVVERMFPATEDLFTSIDVFLSTYVWQYLYFIRRVLVNTLCFPNNLFHILINFIAVKLLISESLRLVVFITNIYLYFKGGVGIHVPQHGEWMGQMSEMYY